MNRSLNIGKVLGTKIALHWTFIPVIAGLYFYGLVNNTNPDGLLLMTGLVLLLVLSIFLREFVRLWYKRQHKIFTSQVMWFPLGSVSQTYNKAGTTPLKVRLFTASSGLVLDILILTIVYLAMGGLEPYGSMGTVLSTGITKGTFMIHFFLALGTSFVIRLLPVFPFDGGKLVRATLSHSMSMLSITKIVMASSQFTAWVMIVLGIMAHPLFFLIGLIVFLGANLEAQIVQKFDSLSQYKAEDAMNTDFGMISSSMTINQILDHLLVTDNHLYVVIEDDGVAKGTITRTDLMEFVKLGDAGLSMAAYIDTEIGVVRASEPLSNTALLEDTSETPTILVKEKSRIKGIIGLRQLRRLFTSNGSVNFK